MDREGLDWAIAEAASYGLRLILTFTNALSAYGGAPQVRPNLFDLSVLWGNALLGLGCIATLTLTLTPAYERNWVTAEKRVRSETYQLLRQATFETERPQAWAMPRVRTKLKIYENHRLAMRHRHDSSVESR